MSDEMPGADAAGYARAAVEVGDSLTSYAVAGPRGRGVPVLLLAVTPERDPLHGPLLAALASRTRVIVVQPPVQDAQQSTVEGDTFASWLRDFLDGLGVDRISIVAGEPFAIGALRFAIDESPRVRQLVLVVRDSGQAIAPHWSELLPPGTRYDVRLLVVSSWSEQAATGAARAEAIARFLLGGEEAERQSFGCASYR